MQEQLRSALLIASFGLQVACATTLPPKIQQMDCASAHFPVQLSMAGSLEGFAGQYSNGLRSFTLRQDGYAVLLAGDTGRERELRETGEWRFQDA